MNETDATGEAVGHVRIGIYLSAIRCLVSYAVIPMLGAAGVFAGLLGLAGVGLQITGAVLCTLGAYRLWQLRYRARYVYTAVAVSNYLLTVLIALG
ncbi:MAG: hypothetical protein ACRCYU_00185 [Nocardioides sp.]